jgi:MSHA biogenesis protein MshQ
MDRNLMRHGFALLGMLVCALAEASPHFSIVHAENGIYCAPETVTVYVRDENDNPLTTYDQSMTLNTGSGAGGWSLGTGGGAFSDGAANDGLATYTWPGNQSSATFVLSYPSGASGISLSARQTNDSSVHDSGTATTNGVAFALRAYYITSSAFTTPAAATFTSPQTAGSSVTFNITAYGQTSAAGACGIIKSYTNRKLSVWFDYVNPGSGTRGVAIPATSGSVIPTSQASAPQLFTLTASGKIASSLKYRDVGAINLHVVDSSGIAGTSGAIVFKPSGFSLAVARTSNNATAPTITSPSTNSPAFMPAGDAMTITVTALESGGTPAPNFGQETPAEAVGLQNGLVTLATTTDATHNPAITGAIGFGPFTNGVAKGTDFTWPEVGIIKLNAHVADGSYLGATDAIGTGIYIGRFIPAKFSVTANVPAFATQCTGGHFSYIGQYFKYTTAPVLTVTAQTRAGVTTQNYTGGWRKLTNATLTTPYAYAISPTQSKPTYYHDLTDTDPTKTRLDPSKLPAMTADPAITDLKTGALTLTFDTGATGLAYTRSTPTAAFDARVTASINISDSDSVTPLKADNATADNPMVIGSTTSGIDFDNGANMRYGRIAFKNASGPEILDLALPMHVEYYKDDTSGFVVNTDESTSCATLGGASPLTLAYAGAVSAATSPVRTFLNPPVAGDYGLSFQAPGAGKYGTVKVTPTCTGNCMTTNSIPSWLRFDWNTSTPTTIDNPAGIATFGIYNGNSKRVYQREQY